MTDIIFDGLTMTATLGVPPPQTEKDPEAGLPPEKAGQEPPAGSFLASYKRVAKRMLTGEVFDILDELGKIAQRYQIGTNQLAVAWLLSKPYVTSVIMGGSRAEHFEQLYSTVELKIDSADLDLIDKLSAAKRYRPFDNQPIVQGAPPALDRW